MSVGYEKSVVLHVVGLDLCVLFYLHGFYGGKSISYRGGDQVHDFGIR